MKKIREHIERIGGGDKCKFTVIVERNGTRRGLIKRITMEMKPTDLETSRIAWHSLEGDLPVDKIPLFTKILEEVLEEEEKEETSF